jgi:DNA polymerase-1
VLFAADGNFFLHRAFHASVHRRNPDYIDKNVTSMFLSQIVQDLVRFRVTHAAVGFDSKRSFRYDIYKGYKENRHELQDEGLLIQTPKGERTLVHQSASGAFVSICKRVITAAGIRVIHRKGLEADDILGALATHLPGKIILGTRDKDMIGLLTERVKQWWPIEKRLIDVEAAYKYYKVKPSQMRDYLCLVGDQVDSIPGVDGVGKQTAVAWLTEYGSIAGALKNKKIRQRLKPFGQTLQLARLLITLKTDDLGLSLDDLVIRKPDIETLQKLVWKIPTSLAELGEVTRATKMKGLFR